MTSDCFEELGRNLSATLTKDFTKAITVVGDQVNTNTKNIESIRSAIRRIEEESGANDTRMEKRFEKLESVIVPTERYGIV